MARLDVTRPVRATAAGIFAYESIGIIESLFAEKKNRKRKFLTVSEICWKQRKLIPVIITGLGVHLILVPEEAKRRVDGLQIR